MYEWQPKVYNKNSGDLSLERNYGIISLAPIKTDVHCSEGDTLFIKQKDWNGETQKVDIMRNELYDILFNFMSIEELLDVAHAKIKQRVKDEQYKPCSPKVEK